MPRDPGARVLVLGGRGMLGHMLVRQLSRVEDLDLRWTSIPGEPGDISLDAADQTDVLARVLEEEGPFHLIINGIAMLQRAVDEEDPDTVDLAGTVNGAFPKRVAAEAEQRGARMIHISTDAVFAPDAGVCDESTLPSPTDAYGRSKHAGEVISDNALTLRLSIIGPNPSYGAGLFEWLRKRGDCRTIPGFVDQRWVGCTTLHVANLCRELLADKFFDAARAEGPIHHVCPFQPVSKFELMQALADALALKVNIEPVESGKPITRQLDTRYQVLAGAIGKYQPLAPGLKALAGLRT